MTRNAVSIKLSQYECSDINGTAGRTLCSCETSKDLAHYWEASGAKLGGHF